ncbi:Squalene/phytoene synthase [Candidatus Terasakiella magnetica]|uniref:Squalene/phytoene synthase n=1 Tax=Candidatus Terasakiella magnetica TaxID=1867952 RepID=A0A1C3RCD9_9PROT|nr:squalene/phytoene synthase family protein [Candidatus Terasakiella magnetica]SCA54947.1 Squalene/phytoene synthase [Candidatus Terasakiella magnetica]
MSKNANTENFPVASLLLAPSVRSEVMEFYSFARKVDDIADSAHLSADEKHQQLDMKTESPFLKDLLVAFRQDVDQNRYKTWDELLDYCQYSANPVGRFLLHVHGESPEGQKASDALCSALQILNHLQDCQKDYKAIDRIYLPEEFLKDGESYEHFLSLPAMEPRFREIFDLCLERTQALLLEAIKLPKLIKNKRLRYQAKVTVLCGLALAGKLRRNDPLANRVELSKLDKLLLAYKGFYPL